MTEVEIKEAFKIIRNNDDLISELELKLKTMKNDNKVLSDELVKYATENKTELDGGDTGYVVREVKGKSTTKWNEDYLFEVCPDNIKDLIFKKTYTLDKTVARSLIDGG